MAHTKNLCWVYVYVKSPCVYDSRVAVAFVYSVYVCCKCIVFFCSLLLWPLRVSNAHLESSCIMAVEATTTARQPHVYSKYIVVVLFVSWCYSRSNLYRSVRMFGSLYAVNSQSHFVLFDFDRSICASTIRKLNLKVYDK